MGTPKHSYRFIFSECFFVSFFNKDGFHSSSATEQLCDFYLFFLAQEDKNKKMALSKDKINEQILLLQNIWISASSVLNSIIIYLSKRHTRQKTFHVVDSKVKWPKQIMRRSKKKIAFLLDKTRKK